MRNSKMSSLDRMFSALVFGLIFWYLHEKCSNSVFIGCCVALFVFSTNEISSDDGIDPDDQDDDEDEDYWGFDAESDDYDEDSEDEKPAEEKDFDPEENK